MKDRFGRTVCVTGFVLFLLVLWSASAIAAHYQYAYRFQKPEIVNLPNGRHLVKVANTRNNDDMVGAPILPVKTARLFFPADEEVISVDVKESKPINVEGIYNVQFAPTARPLSAVGPFPPDVPAAIIYEKDAFFPPGLYKKKSPQFLLGVQIAEVDLAPVQYNPSNGKLKYYERMEVFITTRKSVKPEKVVRYRGLSSDKIKILKTVDNKADFIAAEEGESLSSDSADPTGGGVSIAATTVAEYLVITTLTLKPAFQVLTDHRSSLSGGGYTTHIEDIANIDATYSGVDLAEKVRNYIRDMYNVPNGTRFVVLGGDVDLIPTRGCYAVVGSYTDYNIPSDLYFGCLDGTWNEDGDDIWGETNDGPSSGDIDWYSEVYVGRISADNPSEASNHIQKIIASETSSHPNRTLMVGEKLDDTPTWGGDRMDWVYSYMDGAPVTKLYDKNGTWSKSDLIYLINDMNQQHFWINHLGHSNSTYNMKLGNYDIGSMSNNDYFLVYSQGCYSGNIEYDDCFGEVITNNHNDRGAYAYIGNSRYGWYNSGTYVTGASNLMHKEFVEAVFTDNFTRLGEANQIPKATLHSGTYRWIAFETNLLGCPAYDLNPNYCSSDQDCSDGLYCNGLESCDGGVCQEGEPFVCDDGVFCNGQEECVEVGEQADCVSSGDPCEPPLMCDEDTGSCTECLADADCDDGEVCTTDRCDMGECGNIWPACGQQDGCCDPDCNGQEEDPDCLCGNDLCEPGEDCDSCPKDCISDTGSGTCGACFKGVCNGDCHPNKEGPDCADCSPSYCCGDSFCEGNENSGNCEIDCGSGPGCGDGICDPGENSCNCQLDCGAAPGTEIPNATCSDGLDNDCDGSIDCSDTEDCSGEPTCSDGCKSKSEECRSNSECCSGSCHPKKGCR